MKANKYVLKFWNEFVKGNDQKRIASQPIPQGYDEIKDVEYLDDGNVLHKYDVYRPSGNDDILPVIVDIHGGGWYYGDKELNSYFCKSLTQHGFAVVNLSYRLSPEVDFYTQVWDCMTAIEHIYAHASEYHIDTDRMFLAGDSAGGHIVGIISNILKNPSLQQRYNVSPSVDIKASALICPACEPTNMFGLGGILPLYFNPVFGKGYLKNGSAKIVSFKHTFSGSICPCFFVTGHADFLKKQTLSAHKLLQSHGIKTGLFYGAKVKGSTHKLDHVFNVSHWEWQEAQDANKAMCDFFKEVLENGNN